jgi:hypothetical protein
VPLPVRGGAGGAGAGRPARPQPQLRLQLAAAGGEEGVPAMTDRCLCVFVPKVPLPTLGVELSGLRCPHCFDTLTESKSEAVREVYRLSHDLAELKRSHDQLNEAFMRQAEVLADTKRQLQAMERGELARLAAPFIGLMKEAGDGGEVA